eukprot:COSAG02_NODE_2124_length_9749_cov_7.636166_1_plen_39_part_10
MGIFQNSVRTSRLVDGVAGAATVRAWAAGAARSPIGIRH